MIVYHGSILKFHQFEKKTVEQKKLPNEIDTIGLWFTSDSQSAKPFAIGTETVIEKSTTEFWEDGEPKVVQYEKPVHGYVYKVYTDDPNVKVYESYDFFMEERDKYCDYAGKKKNLTWKDKAILLNKDEANTALRQNLMKHGYEGIVIRNKILDSRITDLYCLFSEQLLQIADVISVDTID